MLNAEILLQRAGNFTASENHKLMSGWKNKKPNTSFAEFDDLYSFIKPIFETGVKKILVGDIQNNFSFKVNRKMICDTLDYIKYETPPTGLVTYAQEKAMELLFEPDPSLNFSTVHTLNGEERELECMELLADETNLNFEHTGDNQIHIHANEIGCTPDGIMVDDLDLIETGAEVKCKSPLVHAKNLLIENNKDLQEVAFDHFVQTQTAMLVTGAKYWYFANYNPYAKKYAHKFKYIVVDRDDDFIKILNSRINIAKKIKSDFLLNFKDKKTQEIEEKPKLLMGI